MSPENYIEKARRALLEQEEIEATSAELFHTAIHLLKGKGKSSRRAGVFKFQKIDHVLNSSYPPVNVSIEAGANLKQARTVQIQIQGLGRLQVRRERELLGNKEKFIANSWVLELDGLKGIEGCLAIVNQIVSEQSGMERF